MGFTNVGRPPTQEANKQGSFDDLGRQGTRSCLMGTRNGCLALMSDRRGEAMPARASTLLQVESYNANVASNDPAEIIADITEADGSTTAYFGPAFNDSAKQKMHNKVWRRSDWSVGKLIVIYSGTGTGQWVWCTGRDPEHPRKFYLSHPLATAPVAGDHFSIGAKPLWLVFPDAESYPLSGDATIGNFEVEVRNRGSNDLSLIVEKYVPATKNTFQTPRPGFPYASTSSSRSLAESTIKSRAHVVLNISGRRVAVGLVDLVAMGDDYTIEACSYTLTRERYPKQEVM